MPVHPQRGQFEPMNEVQRSAWHNQIKNRMMMLASKLALEQSGDGESLEKLAFIQHQYEEQAALCAEVLPEWYEQFKNGDPKE